MDTNAIMGYCSFAISIASIVLGIINHRRVRSNCCGRVGEVALDIENTSPLLNGANAKRTENGSAKN